MARHAERECLYCGMLQPAPSLLISERARQPQCIKCDAPLMDLHDGSTLTLDIAHHHETVAQALDKLDRALARAWQAYARSVRLIVGGGVIRDAVLAELYFMHSKGTVLEVHEENRGAVLVRIR